VQQQFGERFGHGRGRIPEGDADLALLVGGDVGCVSRRMRLSGWA
jgi:hypothetical protein